MLASRREVLTHPMFYDALSGFFKPKSDPAGRERTLARLAYAAILRGDPDTDGFEKGRGGFVYTPSWAPHVVAGAYGDLPQRGRPMVIECLTLSSTVDLVLGNNMELMHEHSNGQHDLQIDGELLDEAAAEFGIVPDENRVTIAIENGGSLTQLNHVQDVAAALGGNFFDRVADATLI